MKTWLAYSSIHEEIYGQSYERTLQRVENDRKRWTSVGLQGNDAFEAPRTLKRKSGESGKTGSKRPTIGAHGRDPYA